MTVAVKGAIVAKPELQNQGNPECVAMLRKWLWAAERGSINFAAVVVCQAPDVIGFDFAGVTYTEEMALEAIGLLAVEIDGMIGERTPPEPEAGLDASYVTYNVTGGATGYDIITWLIDAEMTRIRAGAPAPLKVHFWMGKDGTGGLNTGTRRQQFDNIVKPALALIGAVETDRIGACKNFYASRDIVAASRAGEKVPSLQAPRGIWRGSRGHVTITLREIDFWPHRNSNLKAWLMFALDLQRKGEHVIFVRDTARADDALEGLTGIEDTDPVASKDLLHRMVLYCMAKCNLFVSNGPGALAVFSDRPYLQFIEPTDDSHPYVANTRKFWREQQGIEVGEQWPWARPDQRIVWAKDDYETIVQAWETYIAPQIRQEQSHGIVEHPRVAPQWLQTEASGGDSTF